MSNLNAPVEFGKFVDVLKKPYIPPDPVDYTKLRVGDLVEEQSSSSIKYGVVVAIGWKTPVYKDWVWALWMDTPGNAKKGYFEHPDLRNRLTEGGNAAFTTGTTYRILERNLHLRGPDVKKAPVEFEKYVDILKKVPEGPATFGQIRVGDLVENPHGEYGVVYAKGFMDVAGREFGEQDAIWSVYMDTPEEALKVIKRRDIPRPPYEDPVPDVRLSFVRMMEPGEARAYEFSIISRGHKYATVFQATEFEKFTKLLKRPQWRNLRIGDLIQVEFKPLQFEREKGLPGTMRYGVVFHIGYWGDDVTGSYGPPDAMWAFYSSTPDLAVARYARSPPEVMKPSGEKGELSYISHERVHSWKLLSSGHERPMTEEKKAPVEQMNATDFEKFSDILWRKPPPKEPVKYDNLKPGDLVEYLGEVGTGISTKGYQFGVVVWVGVVPDRLRGHSVYSGDPISVWALWKGSEKEALDAFYNTPKDEMTVEHKLAHWITGGPVYRVIKRGLMRKNAMEAPVELERFRDLLKHPKEPVTYDKLRVGDLVDYGSMGGNRYGVVARVGSLGKGRQTGTVPDDAVWAIWKSSRDEATAAYLSASDRAIEYSSVNGGELTYTSSAGRGEPRRYKVLERGIKRRGFGAPVELEKYTKLLKNVPRISVGLIRVGDLLRRTEEGNVVYLKVLEQGIDSWGQWFTAGLGSTPEDLKDAIPGKEFVGRTVHYEEPQISEMDWSDLELVHRPATVHDAPVELEKYGQLLKKKELPRPIAVKDVRAGDLLHGKFQHASEHYLEVVATGDDMDGHPYFIAAWGYTPEEAHAVIQKQDMAKQRAGGFKDWGRQYEEDWADLKLLRRSAKVYTAPVELEKFEKLLKKKKPQWPPAKVYSWADVHVGDLVRSRRKGANESMYSLLAHKGIWDAEGTMDTLWLDWHYDEDNAYGLRSYISDRAYWTMYEPEMLEKEWEYPVLVEGDGVAVVRNAPVELGKFIDLLKREPLPRPIEWKEIRTGDLFSARYKKDKKVYYFIVEVVPEGIKSWEDTTRKATVDFYKREVLYYKQRGKPVEHLGWNMVTTAEEFKRDWFGVILLERPVKLEVAEAPVEFEKYTRFLKKPKPFRWEDAQKGDLVSAIFKSSYEIYFTVVHRNDGEGLYVWWAGKRDPAVYHYKMYPTDYGWTKEPFSDLRKDFAKPTLLQRPVRD